MEEYVASAVRLAPGALSSSVKGRGVWNSRVLGKGSSVGEPFTEPVSRRVALQRAAQLGVALAAATPVVQGLGRVAAYASESDLPGQYRPPSNFQVEFADSDQEATKKFALKFDPADEGWDAGWDLIGTGGTCFAWVSDDPTQAREDSEPYIPDFAGTVSTIQDGDRVTAWVFTPPDLHNLPESTIRITSVMMKDGSFEDKQCMLAEPDDGKYIIRVLEPGTA